jgi:hydroxymethylpyrimidine pyrophosphatase-like HAD family hydrolase
VAGFVQAIALDLDGTLTVDGLLATEVLAAMDDCRTAGVALILVTGRIRQELQRDYPQLPAHLDAIVYENGAVLQLAGQARPCAPAIDPVLTRELHARGVPFRQGEVVLAGRGCDAETVIGEISRLGLDAQVVHNRSELMVLPAGVSKGTGLRLALDWLEVSPHNTVAIGDAENDLSMLETAEIGVAVGNAIESVRRRADLRLDDEPGAVARFLRGPVVRGGQVVRTERHRVRIGQTPEGEPVYVPGAQARILICGASGTGKSHLTGLLVERWVEARYTALVIDPEGDHAALSRLHNTFLIDAAAEHSARDLAQLLRRSGASVVLDLSRLTAAEARHYLDGVAGRIETLRSRYGRPHWVVIDEAHGALGGDGSIIDRIRLHGGGYCYVTYLPECLNPATLAGMDLTLSPIPPATAGHGEPALVRYRPRDAPESTCHLDRRITPHVRHRHKYADTPLPSQRRFAFREPTGAIISAPGTMQEFEQQLRQVAASSVQHHALNRDFSRWAFDVLQDRELGELLLGAENELDARHTHDLARFREQLLAEVRSRYLGEEADPG